MTPDVCYCHKCNHETRWETYKALYLRCSQCRDFFPCKKECDHLDCLDEKSNWKINEHQDLYSVPDETGPGPLGDLDEDQDPGDEGSDQSPGGDLQELVHEPVLTGSQCAVHERVYAMVAANQEKEKNAS